MISESLCLFEPELRAVAEEIGDSVDTVEVLRNKRSHVVTARVTGKAGESAIAKVWRYGVARGMAHRVLGSSNCDREWAALRRLHDGGVSVPRPLGRRRVGSAGCTDVLVTEDLGRCERLSDHAKAMVVSGNAAGIAAVEAALVAATVGMVDAGVLDSDHSMTNFVLTPNGRIARLDLELAHVVRDPARSARLYGEMVGKIIGTYVFAVQPQLEHAQRLAETLSAQLGAPPDVLGRAGSVIDEMLAYQRATRGVDSRLDLGWA